MHRNAILTVRGRQILCDRIRAGRPVAHVAEEMGISRATAYKWWKRFAAHGAAGLLDRSSRPCSCPTQTAPGQVKRILTLRTTEKLGPFRIGARLGLPPSTVHKVLVREQVNVLKWLDRPTGETIRRYERKTPGELVHIDIKKLGRIPKGGGHRMHGRGTVPKQHVGYDYIHVAVDDHSRLVYAEVFPNEQAETVTAFFDRATAFYAEHGIHVQAILTDNGPAYRSGAFNAHLADTHVKHKYTRAYRPQTNGKVERFNRTLLEEWAYVRPYTSNSARTRTLKGFLHKYNYHRAHSALDGRTPIDRVNNVCGHYT